MVVCAGAKSILDLGLTLEYLGTHGVPVIGYGTEELPAFYTGPPASLWITGWILPGAGGGLQGPKTIWPWAGMLVTNPIPEAYSMDPAVINGAIDRPLPSARRRASTAKPPPLPPGRVAEITGGDSLASNIQLVYNNARLAAQTAAAYCQL